MVERGRFYTTQHGGKTIIVQASEIEQRIGTKHGKWICINQGSGSKVWRTARQLYALSPEQHAAVEEARDHIDNDNDVGGPLVTNGSALLIEQLTHEGQYVRTWVARLDGTLTWK